MTSTPAVTRVLAITGSALIALGCISPYAAACDICNGQVNPYPSLVNDISYRTSWLVVVPALAIVVTLAVLVLRARRRARSLAIATRMLTVGGLVTVAFFLWVGTFPHRVANVGLFAGLLGGLLVAIAGFYISITQSRQPGDGKVMY